MTVPKFRHSGYVPLREDVVFIHCPGEHHTSSPTRETPSSVAPLAPKFSRPDDPLARAEVEGLLDRFSREGLSLEDTTKLLIRSVVDSHLDTSAVRRAVSQALKSAENSGELVMVVQALRHLAAEYDAAVSLDNIAAEVEADALDAREPEDRVRAFNALRGWRNDRVHYVLETFKMLRDAGKDTALSSAVRELARTLENAPPSSKDSAVSTRLAELPKESRRDIASILRWLSTAGTVDLEVAVEKLAGSGHEPD